MLDQLSTNEIERYSRHLSLNEVGIKGQQKLKHARILCVGVGGLGSPLCLYLAAAGIGTIGIIDPDVVEINNLQRQVIYSSNDQGKPKVLKAKERLLGLNPHIKITTYQEALTEHNAFEIFENYDLVVDGTDNFATRFLINDVCFYLKKPNVYASIFQFEGQITVFNYLDNNSPCYRCLYKEAPPLDLIPSCAEGGVLGVLPGIMGTLQANEAIKHILNIGKSLMGRLLTIDALSMAIKEFPIMRDPNCELCAEHKKFNELKRPQYTCQNTNVAIDHTKEISVHDFKELRAKKDDFILIDVRQPDEYEICNLGGKLMPLSDLPARLHELNRDQLIITHCKVGARGNKAAQLLREQGFTDVKNLSGGIIEWIKQIDPSMPKY